MVRKYRRIWAHTVQISSRFMYCVYLIAIDAYVLVLGKARVHGGVIE